VPVPCCWLVAGLGSCLDCWILVVLVSL
jgi:hypothetical protein